jgi:predicted nucleic-acid-binding Zn-ribbon protein
MKLTLSCYCCGSTEFKRTEQPCYNIEGNSYLAHDDLSKATVICKKCGLKDYVHNLVIKYEIEVGD